MQLSITGKNIEINDVIRKHVEKKIGRLDRYLPNIMDGRVELTVNEGARAAEDRQIAQVTLRTKNVILRAEEASSDIFASIDAVFEKMQRQVDRYKGKRWSKRAESGEAAASAIGEIAEAAEEDVTEEAPSVARVKRFEMVPMDEAEAIEQMELLGHDFYVFFNVNQSQLNVLYRRRNGEYGLIQPELA